MIRDIADRLELFIDSYLIERLDRAALTPHEPRDEGPVLHYDQPWEGVFSHALAAMRCPGQFRLYYRGMPPVKDGDRAECTCVAFSDDGVHWTRPELGLYELHGRRDNNAVLADLPPFSHNFMPFLDARPGVPDDERFKAVAGIHRTGLHAFASGDGLRWRALQDEPILTSEAFAFDSPNLAFWSDAEQRYVCYFRTWKNKVRWISRAESEDFLHWSPPQEMRILHQGRPAPIEHLYTNATQPYSRAPHIYIALPRRFMPGRRVLSDEEAERLGVYESQRDSCSDVVLLTSRGGDTYERPFLEAYLRPGADRRNWTSRPGTVAAGLLQTGPREMSFFRNSGYGSPDNHARRFSLRLDGFVSVRAGYAGGELLTRPLTFAGARLHLNYSTSAAGSVRVEAQDEQGDPLPGFELDQCLELVGDEIDRIVSWRAGSDMSALAGRPVRLRIALQDADLFSIQWRPR